MLQQLRPALMAVLTFTVLTGLVFPAVVWGASRVLFPHQAAGSLITRDGRIVGSDLIGQGFTGAGYFHPRPSAAGSGYDASSSGGTNLGPTSAKLINGVADDPKTEADEAFAGVKQLAAAYRQENGLAPDAQIPADAVTRSASGLDPHISPANALLQSGRVARVRGLSEEQVRRLVTANIEGRQLGLLGEPCVNVLRLNLALDAVRK